MHETTLCHMYWLHLDFGGTADPDLAHIDPWMAVDRLRWRRLQFEFLHDRRSRYFLFEYAMCSMDRVVKMDSFSPIVAYMTSAFFFRSFRSRWLQPDGYSQQRGATATQASVGGYPVLAGTVEVVAMPSVRARQARDCVYLESWFSFADRQDCTVTLRESHSVSDRMYGVTGIDMRVREAIATSQALASRGHVMPLLTSLPVVLSPFETNLLPETDPLAFESCAVEGSGGHLLGRGLGSEIDGHDAVFRFNFHSLSPTEDLGNRTSIRVVGR